MKEFEKSVGERSRMTSLSAFTIDEHDVFENTVRAFVRRGHVS